MCLFPAIPRFAAAGLWEPCCSPPAVLGSGHLMETFIPSAPLHHWAASPKMHPALHTPLQLCLQSFSFCIPARGCPRVGTRGLMPNPKHMGRAAQEGSTCPGGAAAGAPAPRGMGLAAVPPGCQLHIAEIPKLPGQFHVQAGVWGMLSCCPLGS